VIHVLQMSHMSDVPTKQTLLELLVVSQLDAAKRREQTLENLPSSMEYMEEAASLRSEIVELKSRAERLSEMIDPMRPLHISGVDQEIAA